MINDYENLSELLTEIRKSVNYQYEIIKKMELIIEKNKFMQDIGYDPDYYAGW